jgi:hypothetical protein
VSVAVSTAAGAIAQWSTVSDDGGQSWLPWSAEPPPGAEILGAPIADDQGRLLMSDDRQLWTSGDRGRTWRPRPLSLPSGAHPLVPVAGSAGALFVVGERQQPGGAALFCSRDGGGSWTEIRLPHPSVALAD